MELRFTSCLGPLFEIETLVEDPCSADSGLPLPAIHEEAISTFTEDVEKRNRRITYLEGVRGVFGNDGRSVSDFLVLFFPQMWKKVYRGWKLSIEELCYLQYVSSAVWESYEKGRESVSLSQSALPLSSLTGRVSVYGNRGCNSTTTKTSSSGSSLPHGSSVNSAENNQNRGKSCDRKSSWAMSSLPHITTPHFQLPIPLFKVILQGETVQQRFHSLSQLHLSTCFLYRVLSWDLGYALRHGGSQFGAYFIGYTSQEDSAGLGLSNKHLNRDTATSPTTCSMASTTASKPLSTLRSPCVSPREGDIRDFLPPTMPFSHHGDVLFFPCSVSKSSTCTCSFSTSPEGDSPSHSFFFKLDSQEVCEGEESSQERERVTETNRQEEESPLLSWNAGLPFSLYVDESQRVRLAQETEDHNSCVKPHVLISPEGRSTEGSAATRMAPSRRRMEEDYHPKEEVDVTRTKVGCSGQNKKQEKKTRALTSSAELPSMVNSGNQVFSFCSFFSSSALSHVTPSTVRLLMPEGEEKSQRNTTITSDRSTVLPFSFSPSPPSPSPSSSFLKAGVMVRTTLELHRLDAIRASRVARSVGKQAYWCGVVNHRVGSWPRWVVPMNNHPQNGGDSLHRVETVMHPPPSHVLGHSHSLLPKPQEGIQKEKCMTTDQCSHSMGKPEGGTEIRDTCQSDRFLFSTAEYLSSSTLSAEVVAVTVLPIL